MGNQNCCDNKNIATESIKTVYPFADPAGVSMSLSKEKSVSKFSASDKENSKSVSSQVLKSAQNRSSKSESAQSLVSRDSVVVASIYKNIEQGILENATRPLKLFGRSDLVELLTNFESVFQLLVEIKPTDLADMPQVPPLPIEAETTLKFYRTKLRQAHPNKIHSCVFQTAYKAKNGLILMGDQSSTGICGDGRILFAPKSFYEGKMQNSLPNGLGIMFYSMSVVYFGNFKDGRRSGKGTLEQRSSKM